MSQPQNRFFAAMVLPLLFSTLAPRAQDIVDPHAKPAIFLPQGVPTPNDESTPAFMPDQRTVYLTDSNTIRVSFLVKGKWTKPVVAAFSGRWHDWDPVLSPDGKRMVFVSNRPLPGMPPDQPQKNAHLWTVDRVSGDAWSAPRHLDAPVNVEGFNDYAPSLSRIGTLCFCSRNRDGNKGMNGYYTKWLGDHYDQPRKLVLNGGSDVFDPFIAPDESYILFASEKCLYISYRQGEGWSQGQKLSAVVNSGKQVGGPSVSPDGKMLYYSQDGAPGIMMVAVNIGPGVVREVIDSAATVSVFAPGVVSSPFEEVAATFLPDGNTVYFAQGTIGMEICYAKKNGDTWEKPKVAPFSGHWGDWDPFLSPDGKRIYFVSNRPLDTTGDNKLKRSNHLWTADRLEGDRWAEPQCLNAPFNQDGIGNFAPTVSRSGDLFFYSPQRDKVGKARSFYAKWMGDHYAELQPLLLNGDEEVSDPLIAPDERYLIFVSGNDLYISYRQGDSWGAGKSLGPQVNTGESNYDPTVSPDGKTLYFTSSRIRGFYKRDPKSLPLDYDGLTREMSGIFNGRGNILMVPIRLPGEGS